MGGGWRSPTLFFRKSPHLLSKYLYNSSWAVCVAPTRFFDWRVFPMSRVPIKKLLLLIMSILTACTAQQPFTNTQTSLPSSNTPTPFPLEMDADSCVVASYVKLCLSFAYADDRGSFVGLEYQSVDNNVHILQENSLPNEIIEDEFLLLDDEGRTYQRQNNSLLWPSEVIEYIGQNTNILAFEPTKMESIAKLIVPYIAYAIPGDTVFEIDLPPVISAGDVFDIDIPLEIGDQTISFRTAEIVECTVQAIYVEGVKIEDQTEPISGAPDPSCLYLRIESTPVNADDDQKIIGLEIEDPNGVSGFNPDTQQHSVVYHFSDSAAFEQNHRLSLTIQSAWVVERGPFELTFQMPYGDENLLTLLADFWQDHQDKLSKSSDEITLNGSVYFAQYGFDPGMGYLLRQQADCLLLNSSCPDAEILEPDFPRNYSLSWSPDGKRAILLETDNKLLRLFLSENGTWQTLDSNITNNGEVGVWSPNSLWFALTIGVAEENQILLLKSDTLETYTFAKDIKGYKELLGWQDADALFFKNTTYNNDGTPQSEIFRGEITSGVWQKLMNWIDGNPIVLSPDGQYFAFFDSEVSDDLLIMDVGGGDIRSLPIPGSHFIQWSPDGQWITTIVYENTHEFICEVHIVHPDGTEGQRVFRGDFCNNMAWEPNSNHILIVDDQIQENSPKLFLVSLPNAMVQEMQVTGENVDIGRIEVFWPNNLKR